nr:MAG TPA: hypothetical protein [Caudoviricetes sp.]
MIFSIKSQRKFLFLFFIRFYKCGDACLIGFISLFLSTFPHFFLRF